MRLWVAQYKVKDITQADFGRLEIDLAEAEMPGLMACRTEFGASQPFKGAKIAGAQLLAPCAHRIIIEHLAHLSYDVYHHIHATISSAGLVLTVPLFLQAPCT